MVWGSICRCPLCCTAIFTSAWSGTSVNESYTLRYMRSEDIPQVIELDRLSFPLPWSSRSYLFEITDNTASHMVTLEVNAEVPRSNGFFGALRRLGTPNMVGTIAGYAGMWLIDGEAHI